MSRNLRISELSNALAVSDRTLIRRFRSVLNQTPLAYLQDLRLEAARALLETSSHRVEEIAGQVGYSDASSFTRLFRQRVGMSPGAYRDRFQIHAPQCQDECRTL
ncbi:helix-turn-helix domain-containing protein [Halomonas sp.]|uniref:helix-turn-helix domain-containing protein n=1 Tax=Halomonas sp. TaxID=1486246 RepID=UPI003D13E0C0